LTVSLAEMNEFDVSGLPP